MHYDVGVVPARPYRPRDKAKVEVGVQIAERWIIAALRHQTFLRADRRIPASLCLPNYSVKCIANPDFPERDLWRVFCP
jgi:hypothetical protein